MAWWRLFNLVHRYPLILALRTRSGRRCDLEDPHVLVLRLSPAFLSYLRADRELVLSAIENGFLRAQADVRRRA